MKWKDEIRIKEIKGVILGETKRLELGKVTDLYVDTKKLLRIMTFEWKRESYYVIGTLTIMDGKKVYSIYLTPNLFFQMSNKEKGIFFELIYEVEDNKKDQTCDWNIK